MQKKENIDIVITWVHNKDSKYNSKRNKYINKNILTDIDGSSSTRFNEVGEIFLCVASIVKFASFVKNIFIVTDNQDPNINDFINKNFPENKIPIIIIDHKEIFQNCELPVFNSLSIETALYKIPNLSNKFVYFNDDIILIRPANVTDWFIENKVVIHGTWVPIFFQSILRLFKLKYKNNHFYIPFGFKDSLVNASKILNLKKYFLIEHTPHPIYKPQIENFFKENNNIFKENIKYKFRSPAQFNPQALSYILLMRDNNFKMAKTKNYLTINPTNRKKDYMSKKLEICSSNTSIKSICVQSLDLIDKEILSIFYKWIDNTLELKEGLSLKT